MENQKENVLSRLNAQRSMLASTRDFYNSKIAALPIVIESSLGMQRAEEYKRAQTIIKQEIDDLDLCILWMLNLKVVAPENKGEGVTA
jgi:hypothetical protein